MYFIGIDISKFKHDSAVIDTQVMLSRPRGHLQMTTRDFSSSKSY